MDQEEEIDEHYSEEQFDKFIKALENIPPLRLNRNDPCPCGSGKKYKKCCLEKDLAPSSFSELRLETFEIKTDALTPEESKNNYPPLLEKDEELLADLFHSLHEHPETIDSENCNYFRQLNKLRVTYPNNPVILNYITSGYQLLEWDEKVDELIAETYEKFPDYLFAQTAQANIYLRDGFAEKAFEVLKGANTLKQLYPHRNVFHITEFRTFEYFMVRYLCITENMKQAEVHLRYLEELLEEDDDLLLHAKKLIREANALHNFKARMSHFLRKAKSK